MIDFPDLAKDIQLLCKSQNKNKRIKDKLKGLRYFYWNRLERHEKSAIIKYSIDDNFIGYFKYNAKQIAVLLNFGIHTKFLRNLLKKGSSMKLKDYINTWHNGNISEFARFYSVKPNQAQRWIDRGCKVEHDKVWCPVTKHKKGDL